VKIQLTSTQKIVITVFGMAVMSLVWVARVWHHQPFNWFLTVCTAVVLVGGGMRLYMESTHR
jgi:hypothetical protein